MESFFNSKDESSKETNQVSENNILKNESAYYYDDREMMVHKIQETIRAVNGYNQMPVAKIPFFISERQDILHYLDVAAIAPEIPNDAGLFCIIHIPEYNIDSPFKTLAFYQDGLILKSNESSNATTNRIFSDLGLNYEHMRSLTSFIEGKACHCQPYIYGNICFMPVNGPSKNAVSWINLSHLVSYNKIKNDKQRVRLFFDNRHVYDMQIRFQTFEEHLQTAIDSYTKQLNYYFQISTMWGYEVMSKNPLYPNSILHKRAGESQINKKTFTVGGCIQTFQYASLRCLIKDSSFKEIPYCEEITESIHNKYFSSMDKNKFP